MGVNPLDLGGFSVTVFRHTAIEGTARKISSHPKEAGGDLFRNVSAVDSKSYKKHGLSYAIG